MTRQELLKEVDKRINKWLDKEPSGMLSVEIHTNDGGISKVHFFVKDTFNPAITSH